MLRKGHHRQVFEMGQEGQEKPESVSSMIGLGNFPIFPTLYTPKGTKGMNFQEFHNIQSWNLSRNFVPFVPYIPQKAFGAYRIVTFSIPPPHGKVMILYALYAQNPLTGTKGTKFWKLFRNTEFRNS